MVSYILRPRTYKQRRGDRKNYFDRAKEQVHHFRAIRTKLFNPEQITDDNLRNLKQRIVNHLEYLQVYVDDLNHSDRSSDPLIENIRTALNEYEGSGELGDNEISWLTGNIRFTDEDITHMPDSTPSDYSVDFLGFREGFQTALSSIQSTAINIDNFSDYEIPAVNIMAASCLIFHDSFGHYTESRDSSGQPTNELSANSIKYGTYLFTVGADAYMAL